MLYWKIQAKTVDKYEGSTRIKKGGGTTKGKMWGHNNRKIFVYITTHLIQSLIRENVIRGDLHSIKKRQKVE